MTDAVAPALPGAAPSLADRQGAMQRRLKQRYAREVRFQWYGRIAIGVAIIFLALLLGRIVAQGHTAFWAHEVSLPVHVDPARVDRSYPEGSNFNQIVAEAMMRRLNLTDDPAGELSGELGGLLSEEIGYQILEQVRSDPGVIGRTIELRGSVSDDADMYFKGEIERTAPEETRQLTDRQLDLLDRMKREGLVKTRINTGLLTRSDSTQPELAGLLGAIVGSLLMLTITGALAIPVGVLTAIYLEEFAPKNRITDLIEVNINNLAAVPSIVYGLLGLALFINWMGLPRSAPLVGGLVLALMALPTIIIATRSAMKAVPPSIREAALGVGASQSQAVFQHVLPLALPGIMTGAILAMAHAVGETAPLLLIGMVAFVPDVPTGFTDAASALPVQIFIWENAAERAFHERTAAAILVLLAFMILMNAAAIYMRRKFERRW